MKFLKLFPALICLSATAQVQFVPLTNGPTVTVSSAYVSGMCVGGVFSFLKPVAHDGGTAILSSLRLWDWDGQVPSLTLLLFNTDPVVDGWTLTDSVGAAAPINSTENPATISILTGDWISAGGVSVITISDINIPVDSAQGQNRTIYGAFVTTSTPTFTTTNSLRVKAFFNTQP